MKAFQSLALLWSTGIALGAFSLPVAAQASSEQSSQSTRAKCVDDSRDLERGVRSRRRTAIVDMQHCDDTGPSVLARSWFDPTLDVESLRALIRSSSMIEDKRLARRLLDIASDQSKQVLIRTAAIATLASYLNASYIGRLTEDAKTQGGIRVDLGMTSHSNKKKGSSPIDSADLSEIRQVLLNLSKRDSSAVVRDLALIAAEVEH